MKVVMADTLLVVKLVLYASPGAGHCKGKEVSIIAQSSLF